MKSLDTKALKEQLIALKHNAKAVMVFIIMIFLLDALLLLRGQFVTVGRLFSEGRSLAQILRAAYEDSRLSPTYTTRLSDIKKDVERWNKMVVSETELPQVLESISKFADISIVRILNIRPISGGVAEQSGTYHKQKISITAKCGFHQLGRFIAMMESSPVFFDLKSVEIRSDASDYSKQQVTIILEVTLQKEYNESIGKPNAL